MLSRAGRAWKGGHRPSSTPCPAVAVAVLPIQTARPLYVTNMKPPKCRLCSGLHWNNEPHVFASNTASNTQPASNNASNRQDLHRPARADVGVQAVDEVGGSVPAGGAPAVGNGSAEVCGPAKQRWPRDAYNAYQREYMRKRRASN
jgi:hypothetical protein